MSAEQLLAATPPTAVPSHPSLAMPVPSASTYSSFSLSVDFHTADITLREVAPPSPLSSVTNSSSSLDESDRLPLRVYHFYDLRGVRFFHVSGHRSDSSRSHSVVTVDRFGLRRLPDASLELQNLGAEFVEIVRPMPVEARPKKVRYLMLFRVLVFLFVLSPWPTGLFLSLLRSQRMSVSRTNFALFTQRHRSWMLRLQPCLPSSRRRLLRLPSNSTTSCSHIAKATNGLHG